MFNFDSKTGHTVYNTGAPSLPSRTPLRLSVGSSVSVPFENIQVNNSLMEMAEENAQNSEQITFRDKEVYVVCRDSSFARYFQSLSFLNDPKTFDTYYKNLIENKYKEFIEQGIEEEDYSDFISFSGEKTPDTQTLSETESSSDGETSCVSGSQPLVDSVVRRIKNFFCCLSQIPR